MGIDWQHILIEGAFVILPLLFAQWVSHRASTKEADKREMKRDLIMQEYPLHGHGEYRDETSEGPLHAENMRFPKIRINGSK